LISLKRQRVSDAVAGDEGEDEQSDRVQPQQPQDHVMTSVAICPRQRAALW
jgi:hypothetical protein